MNLLLLKKLFRSGPVKILGLILAANKDQDNSAIGQGADKIATFLTK